MKYGHYSQPNTAEISVAESVEKVGQKYDEISDNFFVKITPSTGIVARNDALQILRQSLSGSSMHYNVRDIGNSYFAILYNREKTPVTAAVIHLDSFKKLACISLFATDPKWQKRGLGTQLNAYLVEQCTRRGLKICVQASPFAIDWWKSIGYREMKSDELTYYNIKATQATKTGRSNLGGKKETDIEWDVLLYDVTRKPRRMSKSVEQSMGVPRRRSRRNRNKTGLKKQTKSTLTRLRKRKKRR